MTRIFTLIVASLVGVSATLDPGEDSKVTLNVLEGKAEGYCSVSLLVQTCMARLAWTRPLSTTKSRPL